MRRQVWIPFLAPVLILLLLTALAVALGQSPLRMVSVALEGSVGSWFAVRGSLLKAVPLLLTGLAVVIAFRAGVWNIGGEGQFIVGGLVAYLTSPYGVVVSLLAGGAAGAAWASVATLMRLWRNAPEVLTTILLNFVALHLLGWGVNGPLQESARRYPQSDPAASALPAAGDLHLGVVLAAAAAVGGWWLLYRTREGLRLRATGLNPSAARFAGIDVRAQTGRAMALSGALAGLAGGIELLGVTHRLFERFAVGYGYGGIAVALVAQLHPLGSCLSALLFGALTTAAGELQRSAGIAASLAVFGQAAVLLIVIALSGQKRSHD